MSQKTFNRLISGVIFLLCWLLFYVVAGWGISAVFDAGPLTVKGVLLALLMCGISFLFFFLFGEISRDIATGESREYPGY